MIIHDIAQASESWFQLRLGIPTASRFSDIVTSKGNPSKSADKYMDQLLAEYLAGQPFDMEETTHWMKRGNELEPEARKWYEFRKDTEVKQVGFIMEDHGRYGGSPDGLVGEKGILEIKCVKHNTMVNCYRGRHHKKYTQQVQGNLWLAERAYCDFVAYNPVMKTFMTRIQRDDEFIVKLKREVLRFCAVLKKQKEKLKSWKV